jgi:thioredoxin 1
MRGFIATLVVLLVLTGCEQNTCPTPGPSLIAFYATWCQSCQRDKPLLVEVAREFPVTEVNFDTQHDIAARYHVQVLPTYLVFSEGREVMRTMNLHTALQALHDFNQQQ